MDLKKATIKATKSLWKTTPTIIATILLVSLIYALIPNSWYTKVFTKNPILDPLIGSSIGSISAGNPITSYIIGGALLKSGVSLVAVTAFLVAWTTVGLIQFPAESKILGKKFAIVRNLSAFILSILIAIVTVLLMKL